ncbi:MAG: LysM peptidoglycan-binding domain-containing protein [Puniceicoccales bacterium]|jgi:LysM repeat protein|nr:LysM peptidoglycan-binding domain-containing protein [Puniceicoccales bacterium]
MDALGKLRFILLPGLLLLLGGCAGLFSGSHRTTRPPSTYTRADLLGDGDLAAERPIARPRRLVPPTYETHSVVRGDSLWRIAKTHGVSLESLLEANGLAKEDILRVGQELRIPVRPTLPQGREPHTVQRGETLSSLSRSWGCSVADIRQANDLVGDGLYVGQRLMVPAQATVTAAAAARGSGGASYTVRRGDTLSSIAGACGTSVRELCSLNAIAEPNRIREGQILILPAGKVAPATPTPARKEVSRAAPAPVPAPRSPASDDDLLGLFDEADLFSNYN